MSRDIILTSDEINPDTPGEGWWIDGAVLTIRDEAWTAVYKLPKTACVVMRRLGDGRARLALGGFLKTTVSVTGPRDAIERLREAVL